MCDGGVCAGTNLCEGVTCTAVDACHVPGVCSFETGECSNPVGPDSVVCDDGSSETGSGVCQTGICLAVRPAASQCHTETLCNNGVCPAAIVRVGEACDDGNAATDNDVCSIGAICAGEDLCEGITCEAINDCHSAGVCAHGLCSTPQKPQGSGCDDGNPATDFDQCR